MKEGKTGEQIDQWRVVIDDRDIRHWLNKQSIISENQFENRSLFFTQKSIPKEPNKQNKTPKTGG